jgi:type I restriction enzyme S subunit
MTDLLAGWVTKTIGEVATFNRKRPQDKKHSEELASFVPMPKVYETLNRITLDESISHRQGQERSLTYFEDGDVIFAKITPCMENGKIAIAKALQNGCAYGSTEFHVLTAGPDVLAEYLFYFMVSEDFRADAASAMTGAVGQRRVPKSYLEDHLIPLPPLPEQQKIVETLEDHLSRLDAALADVKQAKLKAAQFRRSLLQAAFTGNLRGDATRLMVELPVGWEIKRLGDCLEQLKSGKKAERGWSPQCLSNPSPDENVWGILKTTAVQMGRYESDHNKQLPETLDPKVGLEVNPGDFLVTTTGPRNRCGVVCHVRETRKKLIFSGKILRFRADEDIMLSNWLMYLLMSPAYQVTFDELKVGTSDSSVSIGNQQILDLQIPVPHLSEQQQIVEILEYHLSRLDASVAIADKMEKQSFSLRRSLLQAAFTGQLTKGVASV